MGWRPTRVTYTSDYFDNLYDYAVELIKRGKVWRVVGDVKLFCV